MGDDDDDHDDRQSDGSDPDPGEDTHRERDLSIDAILELLAQHERRRILSYFVHSSERTATGDELVEHLVQADVERTGDVPNRDHLSTMLHHIHLPKLADVGVVEYDRRSQQLRYWGDERLEEWLERVEQEEQESIDG